MDTVDPRRTLVAITHRVQEQKIKNDMVSSVSAKVGQGTDAVSAQSAALIRSVQAQDGVQASADVLKLSAESLAKVGPAAVAPVARSTSAAASVITSVHQAAQGNTYSAASAAASAVEKISPALAKSPVGAIANVLVLSTASQAKETQTQAVASSAKKAFDAEAPLKKRISASFDLTAALQNLANFYRNVGNAAWKLGTFGISRAANVAKLAPAAARAQSGIAKVATSPLGRTVGFLNKWLPFLNIAGVALSAKNAVDVFHDQRASKTSKALSIASIGTAVAALIGGFTLKGLPFVGTIAAGIAADVALANARSSDAQGLDTDAKSRYWAGHPGEALHDLGAWTGRTIPAMITSIKGTLGRGIAHVKTLLTHQ
jgi:hypothetical protein